MSSTLAVFGGSFDPPHLGHRAVVEHLIGAYDLTLVCPNQSNWQKAPSMLSFPERLGLLRSEYESPKVQVCDYPYHLTLDLLMEVRARWREHHLVLAVGEDVQLDSFVGIDKIRQMAEICVVPRSNLSSTRVRQSILEGRFDYCAQACDPKTFKYLYKKFSR